jgi:hypothetical protein
MANASSIATARLSVRFLRLPRALGLLRHSDYLHYFQKVVALPGIPETGTPEECLDAMAASGVAVVGTPEDLIAQIERLEEQSGGFGAFLSITHDWASRDATRRSYELIARYVMPRFQDATALCAAKHGVGDGEPGPVSRSGDPGRDGGDPEGRGAASITLVGPVRRSLDAGGSFRGESTAGQFHRRDRIPVGTLARSPRADGKLTQALGLRVDRVRDVAALSVHDDTPAFSAVEID